MRSIESTDRSQICKLVIIIIIIITNRSAVKGWESEVHPISPKTPALQYQPIDRKKRKGKRV